MLKFLVLVAVCIIGANAQCDTNAILGCLKNGKYSPSMSSADICNVLKADEACMKSKGCDAKSIDAFQKSTCGPGSSCDIKQAASCLAKSYPTDFAINSFIKVASSQYKTCLAKAQCSIAALQHGGPMCLKLN